MSNNLFLQVNDLINKNQSKYTKPSDAGVVVSPFGGLILNPTTGASNIDAVDQFSQLNGRIATLEAYIQSLPPQILSGLNVFAYGGRYIGIKEGVAALKIGTAKYKPNLGDGVYDVRLVDTTVIGTRYVVINSFNPSTVLIANTVGEADLILAKIVINVSGGNIEDNANATFTNNYIVSGKDITFSTEYTIDDDTRFLMQDAMKSMLASNLIGTIRLNEELSITNQQGSVVIDSSSFKLYNDSVKLAHLDRDGVFYFDEAGKLLSQYTKYGATVGNIAILPDALQSLDYKANNTGFRISDTGNAEFNNVKVRGNIVALSGTIGRWIIGTNKLTDINDTTGMSPSDYPFYAGETFFNRASAPFRVDINGEIWATNAHIMGSIEALSGHIGGWTIGATTLTGGGTILDSNGTITCHNIIANVSGQIGGWTINSTRLSSTGIRLDSSNGGEIKVGDPNAAHIRVIGNAGGMAFIESSNFDNSYVEPRGFRFSSDGTIEAVDGYFKGRIIGSVFVKNEVNVVGGALVIAPSTRIEQSILPSVTTIYVQSATFFNNDIVKVGSNPELMRIISGEGSTTYTVSRGYNGTNPNTTHPSKSVILKIGEYNKSNKGYIELIADSTLQNSGALIKIHDVDDVNGTLHSQTVVELGLITQGQYAINQYGLYAQVADITGKITALSGSIGGINMTNNKLYIGTGLYSGITTPFYVDSTGRMSLKDKLRWDGTTLKIEGEVTITGGGGIDWSLVANKPSTLTTPTGTGLFLSSNYLGYYNNGTWMTYMDSSGGFYLGGSSGKLQWNGTTLAISGNITVENTIPIAKISDKSLANLDSTANSKLNGIQAGATVGATWGTNLSNIPSVLGTPSGTGLFLSATHLGFYTGGIWKTYMTNTGAFYLAGAGTDGLSWDGTTLTITGNVNITGGGNGFGDLAYKDSVDLSSTDVSNKSLANLDSLASTKLNGVAAGATVGAVWGTNLSNIPSTLGTPSGTGLFVSPTYLGYYTGGNWKTYMTNTGGFYLSGSGSHGLSWDGTTLNITGVVNITGGISASGIAGLGALAYKNTVDLNTTDVTNKSLANLDSTANSKLSGIQAGATAGATWGTNISNQPSSLAGINSTEGSKLSGIAAGATVGATWGTNLSNIPTTLTTPSGAGLFLSASYMGYYNGSTWKTYMDSAGNFALAGSGSHGLSWNGSTLMITGNMVASSGTIGGWSIGSNVLTGGATTLNSDGTIICKKLIAVTSGTVGGYVITSGAMTSQINNTIISKYGMIFANATEDNNPAVTIDTGEYNQSAYTSIRGICTTNISSGVNTTVGVFGRASAPERSYNNGVIGVAESADTLASQNGVNYGGMFYAKSSSSVANGFMNIGVAGRAVLNGNGTQCGRFWAEGTYGTHDIRVNSSHYGVNSYMRWWGTRISGTIGFGIRAAVYGFEDCWAGYFDQKVRFTGGISCGMYSTLDLIGMKYISTGPISLPVGGTYSVSHGLGNLAIGVTNCYMDAFTANWGVFVYVDDEKLWIYNHSGTSFSNKTFKCVVFYISPSSD